MKRTPPNRKPLRKLYALLYDGVREFHSIDYPLVFETRAGIRNYIRRIPKTKRPIYHVGIFERGPERKS